MATEYDVQNALANSASKLLRREVTAEEKQKLLIDFRAARGTPYQRALAALTKAVDLNESQIQIRAASSDDADRAIKDLEKIAKGLGQ
jgi:hypothetical protein